MRILIVVPRQDRISGNWVTARRFQRGLTKNGHVVAVRSTQLQADSGFVQGINDFTPDVAILLHAYRSGKPWLEATQKMGIPYVVVFTGTDVNQGLNDPVQNRVIRSVVRQAACVLLQNALLLTELTGNCPELTGNLRELSPGIILGESPYDLRKMHNLDKDTTLFLCPAGLRPVKGVAELVKMFDQVAAENAGFQVAFCGPVLDVHYAETFFQALAERPWASYLGPIEPEAMAQAMRGADVIINNSHTEGLANALLEAATLGIPILARNIPGNAAVVRHNFNGLLFDNDTFFVEYALQLLEKKRRQELTHPDPDRYDPDTETAELALILEEAVKAAQGKNSLSS